MLSQYTSTTELGCTTSRQKTSLLKRHLQCSDLEFCRAVKHARTLQYVQGHQACDMSTLNLATTASASTGSVPTAEPLEVAGSSRQVEGRVAGSLTFEQSLGSQPRAAPCPPAPSCSVGCSCEGEPDGAASFPVGDDNDAAPLLELLQVVQQHRRQLEQQPAGMLDAVLETALSDTDAALNIALAALSLATSICDIGSPEAADKALEFAEQALTLTVQRLAKAQMMVLHKVGQQHNQSLPLPESAADAARSLTEAVASDGSGSSSAAQETRGTAAVRDVEDADDDEACSTTGGDY